MSDAHPTSAATTEEGGPDEPTRLCLACGLCCGGALFSFVPVEAHEVARLRTRLPIIQDESDPGFNLPCSGHIGGGCSLYDARPTVCESYSCLQLARLRRGKVTLADALETVQAVRTLFTRVDAALAPGRWLWDRAHDLRETPPFDDIQAREWHEATLLDLDMLEMRIERDLDPRATPDGDEG